MRWQASRGVLNPLHAPQPGSAWWRAVNERLLRDGCESVALGEPRLLELVREANPIYAWPFEERHVWRPPAMPLAGRILRSLTRAR